MSYVNEFEFENKEYLLKNNGYTVSHYASSRYRRIGVSKYFYDVEYIIKDFDKHFKVKNNPFSDNSEKRIRKSISFFFLFIRSNVVGASGKNHQCCDHQ